MRIPSLIAAVLLLGACATGPVGLQDEQRRATVTISGSEFTYHVDFTEEARASAVEMPVDPALAWRVLPAIYDALDIPLGTLRSDVLLLGIERWRMPSRLAGARRSAYLDCGRSVGGFHADLYAVTASVHSQVHPTAGGIRLETKVAASARPRDVSGNPVACTSNGRLETTIASMLRQRLAAEGALALHPG